MHFSVDLMNLFLGIYFMRGQNLSKIGDNPVESNFEFRVDVHTVQGRFQGFFFKLVGCDD